MAGPDKGFNWVIAHGLRPIEEVEATLPGRC
jgi:hypothetical protein